MPTSRPIDPTVDNPTDLPDDQLFAMLHLDDMDAIERQQFLDVMAGWTRSGAVLFPTLSDWLCEAWQRAGNWRAWNAIRVDEFIEDFRRHTDPED